MPILSHNQGARNQSVSVSTTSTPVSTSTSGALRRQMLLITNTSATAVVTIVKGDVLAVAGAGIRLLPSASYVESTDSGFTCWQGAIQAVADAAGTIAIVEQFDQLQ